MSTTVQTVLFSGLAEFTDQLQESCIKRDAVSWPEGPVRGCESSAVVRFSVSGAFRSRAIPQVLMTVVAVTAPGRSVVSQSMTTARRGVSMVRAQWTAWSERRSQAGASAVVVIMGTSLVRVAVQRPGFSTAASPAGYAPVLWLLGGRPARQSPASGVSSPDRPRSPTKYPRHALRNALKSRLLSAPLR